MTLTTTNTDIQWLPFYTRQQFPIPVIRW